MDTSLLKGLDYEMKKEEKRDRLKIHSKLMTQGSDSLTYSELKKLALWGIYRSPLLDAKVGTKDWRMLKKLIA